MADAAIDLEHVDKWFGDFHVLKDVTLHADPGEKLVICGPSGSGKSTLVRCINRLETYQKGAIRVGGVTIDDSRQAFEKIRDDIGMVFQQFNLFPHLTVLENLTLGPMKARGLSRKAAEEKAMTYLDRVQIPEQAGKRPGQLSGGQQQRVAIARSLCMDPSIMLFDEPTSALDPEMIAEVLDVISDLASTGMTLLVVTHEMGFASKVADRMVFMDGGEIVETGPTSEFFAAPRSERCRRFLGQILRH